MKNTLNNILIHYDFKFLKDFFFKTWEILEGQQEPGYSHQQTIQPETGIIYIFQSNLLWR